MIEPLRYNREMAPALPIARPVFCEICKTKKDMTIRRNPNVAVKYCPECTKNFMCFGCDEDLHHLSPANLHVRRILVIGPGVRKKVVLRGDRSSYPMPLDTVSLKFKAHIVHEGKVIHREPVKTTKFMCGLSGNSVHVQVLGARNLIAADSNGTSDPFITGSFCGVTLGATRVRQRSLNPHWDSETFVVPLENREPRRMAKAQKNMFKLEVYDFDWTKVNDFLGHVEISTDRLGKLAEVSNGQPISLPLSLRSFHGTIDIVLGFCRDYLHFKITKAECIDKIDPILLSDPYVVVYFGNKRIGRTPVVRNKTNPHWEKGNIFKVPVNDVLKRERTLLIRGRALAKARQKIEIGEERERRRDEAIAAAKRELMEDEDSQKNGGRPAVNWLNPMSVMEYLTSLGKKHNQSQGAGDKVDAVASGTAGAAADENLQWENNPLLQDGDNNPLVREDTGVDDELTSKQRRGRKSKKSQQKKNTSGDGTDGQTEEGGDGGLVLDSQVLVLGSQLDADAGSVVDYITADTIAADRDNIQQLPLLLLPPSSSRNATAGAARNSSGSGYFNDSSAPAAATTATATVATALNVMGQVEMKVAEQQEPQTSPPNTATTSAAAAINRHRTTITTTTTATTAATATAAGFLQPPPRSSSASFSAGVAVAPSPSSAAPIAVGGGGVSVSVRQEQEQEYRLVTTESLATHTELTRSFSNVSLVNAGFIPTDDGTYLIAGDNNVAAAAGTNAAALEEWSLLIRTPSLEGSLQQATSTINDNYQIYDHDHDHTAMTTMIVRSSSDFDDGNHGETTTIIDQRPRYDDANNQGGDGDRLEQGSTKSSNKNATATSVKSSSQKVPGFTNIGEEIRRRLAEQEAAQKIAAAEKEEQRKRDSQKQEIIEYRKGLRALLNYGNDSDNDEDGGGGGDGGDEETKLEESMTLEELIELSSRTKQGVEGQELPLFRLELFDGNPYRRRVHLGTARVDLRCVRRMLPNFPAVRLIDEELYYDKEEEEEEGQEGDNKQDGIHPKIEPSSSSGAVGQVGATGTMKKPKNVMMIKKYRRRLATPHDPPSFRQYAKRAPRRAFNYCLTACCGVKTTTIKPTVSEKRKALFSLRSGADDEPWVGGGGGGGDDENDVDDACVNDDMSHLDTPGYLPPTLLHDTQLRILAEKAVRRRRDEVRLQQQEESRQKQRELFREQQKEAERLRLEAEEHARKKNPQAAVLNLLPGVLQVAVGSGAVVTAVAAVGDNKEEEEAAVVSSFNDKKKGEGEKDEKDSCNISSGGDIGGSKDSAAAGLSPRSNDENSSNDSSDNSSDNVDNNNNKEEEQHEQNEKKAPTRLRSGTVANFNPLRAGKDLLYDDDDDEEEEGGDGTIKTTPSGADLANNHNNQSPADDDEDEDDRHSVEEHVLTDTLPSTTTKDHRHPSYLQESTHNLSSSNNPYARPRDTDTPPVSMAVWGDGPPTPSSLSPSKHPQMKSIDKGGEGELVGAEVNGAENTNDKIAGPLLKNIDDDNDAPSTVFVLADRQKTTYTDPPVTAQQGEEVSPEQHEVVDEYISNSSSSPSHSPSAAVAGAGDDDSHSLLTTAAAAEDAPPPRMIARTSSSSVMLMSSFTRGFMGRAPSFLQTSTSTTSLATAATTSTATVATTGAVIAETQKTKKDAGEKVINDHGTNNNKNKEDLNQQQQQQQKQSEKSKRTIESRVRFWDESAPLEFLKQGGSSITGILSTTAGGGGAGGNNRAEKKAAEKGQIEAKRLLRLQLLQDDALRKKTIIRMIGHLFQAVTHRSSRGSKRACIRALHFLRKQPRRVYRESGRMYRRQKRRFFKSKFGRWLLPRIDLFHKKMVPVYRATAVVRRGLGVAHRHFTARAVVTARRLGLDKYFLCATSKLGLVVGGGSRSSSSKTKEEAGKEASKKSNNNKKKKKVENNNSSSNSPDEEEEEEESSEESSEEDSSEHSQEHHEKNKTRGTAKKDKSKKNIESKQRKSSTLVVQSKTKKKNHHSNNKQVAVQAVGKKKRENTEKEEHVNDEGEVEEEEDENDKEQHQQGDDSEEEENDREEVEEETKDDDHDTGIEVMHLPPSVPDAATTAGADAATTTGGAAVVADTATTSTVVEFESSVVQEQQEYETVVDDTIGDYHAATNAVDADATNGKSRIVNYQPASPIILEYIANGTDTMNNTSNT